MRGITNTRQRKVINPEIVAVKVERRVEGQKVEKRVANTGVMTEEAAHAAKKIRKKRSRNLITVKIEIRLMNLIRNTKTTQKEGMVREIGQSQGARKELIKKMSTDRAAETETELDVHHQRIEKTNEKKREEERAAGVRRGGTTVTGRVRDEAHPEIKNVEPKVQTETSLETHTEADAPEARAAGEITAKIDRLIGRTETEKLLASGEDAAAAALTVIEIKGKARGVQILEEEPIVLPKTEEAQPDRNQTVQKAEIRISPAPALTVTEPVLQPFVPMLYLLYM